MRFTVSETDLTISATHLRHLELRFRGPVAHLWGGEPDFKVCEVRFTVSELELSLLEMNLIRVIGGDEADLCPIQSPGIRLLTSSATVFRKAPSYFRGVRWAVAAS